MRIAFRLVVVGVVGVVGVMGVMGCGGRVEEGPATSDLAADSAPTVDAVKASADAIGETIAVVEAGTVDVARVCVPGRVIDEPSSVCQPEDVLRSSATTLCGSAGVASFAASGACDGTFRYRTYTCCDASGDTCDAAVLDGGDTSCKPVAIWHEYSVKDCADHGKVLQESTFSLSVPCASTPTYHGFRATCCRP
jgi:hypothetical protein